MSRRIKRHRCRSLSTVNAGGLVGSLSWVVETSRSLSKGVVVGWVVNEKLMERPRLRGRGGGVLGCRRTGECSEGCGEDGGED